MSNGTSIIDAPPAIPAAGAPSGPVPVADRSDLVYFTPLPIRLWHWLNAAAILALIFTGIQLRFPDKVALLDYKLSASVHEWAGIGVVVLFFWWGAYYGIVGKRALHVFRLYVPRREDIWPGLLRQAMFYLWGYFRGEEHPYMPTPDNKFNPLQKVFYALLMFVVMPLLCVTGLGLLNVTPLRELLTSLGGVKLFVGLHYLLAAFVVMFLLIHIYLCTLGETFWSDFSIMASGWAPDRTARRAKG
jgi:thiosulfate reductase cytochrome b subunit